MTDAKTFETAERTEETPATKGGAAIDSRIGAIAVKTSAIAERTSATAGRTPATVERIDETVVDSAAERSGGGRVDLTRPPQILQRSQLSLPAAEATSRRFSPRAPSVSNLLYERPGLREAAMKALLKRIYSEEEGAIGYIVLWALGVPTSLLFIAFLLRGCT